MVAGRLKAIQEPQGRTPVVSVGITHICTPVSCVLGRLQPPQACDYSLERFS